MNRWILPLLTLTVLVVTAGPAAADPAGPTHYQSTIVAIDAEGDVPVTVEIMGGDAYLVLRVPPGVQVEVPGYEGEPYLRVLADGTVQINERSPARWLNDARYGEGDPNVEVPAGADAQAPPDWRHAADGGVYAWHDHRIHWMSPSLPRHVDPTAGTPQPVQDWEVPLLVDGVPVTVRGELVWLPGPSPAGPVALVGGLVLVMVALAVIRPDRVPWMVLGGALATGAASLASNVGLPPGADGDAALVILPLLALALAALGLRLTSREEGWRGPLIGAAGGVPLLVWGILKSGALTRPIVPPPLPTGLVRFITALALAIGVAAAVALVRRAIAATALEEDEDQPAAA